LNIFLSLTDNAERDVPDCAVTLQQNRVQVVKVVAVFQPRTVSFADNLEKNKNDIDI
jgi:hypothetical protein